MFKCSLVAGREMEPRVDRETVLNCSISRTAGASEMLTRGHGNPGCSRCSVQIQSHDGGGVGVPLGVRAGVQAMGDPRGQVHMGRR